MTGEACPSTTIGAELERARLKRRSRQLQGMLELLRRRTQASTAGPLERTGLHRALADFTDELNQITERLLTDDQHSEERDLREVA
jgi:ABC-type phosphate transport system auxiliary subunit